MEENTFAIAVKEFVKKVTAGGGEHPSPADCVEYGLQRGWLEPQDVAGKEDDLLRKQAARILHKYLRLELKESDEVDGSPAYVLQDLFDCRVCAGHIIQVYVKGIMDGVMLTDGRMIFSAEDSVSEAEAEEIVSKMFQTETRTPRAVADVRDDTGKEPSELSLEQAMQLLQETKHILLVDVRTAREYEENPMENAINVPLLSLVKNPFIFSENRDKKILLYCHEGYQSKVAAQCLLEAGYENVAFFAKKEKN